MGTRIYAAITAGLAIALAVTGLCASSYRQKALRIQEELGHSEEMNRETEAKLSEMIMHLQAATESLDRMIASEQAIKDKHDEYRDTIAAVEDNSPEWADACLPDDAAELCNAIQNRH